MSPTPGAPGMVRAHELIPGGAAPGGSPGESLGGSPDGPPGPAPRDAVTLAYDARWRRRGRLTTDGGEDVMLDLPEAAELREGDALLLSDGRRIALRAAPEPLAEARAEDARHLARLAWHVGNRHTPCALEADRLLIQRDHVLEGMLAGLGARIAHIEAPFRPEGGAYGHGRTHGHAHSHDPHHDPDAHLRGEARPPQEDA